MIVYLAGTCSHTWIFGKVGGGINPTIFSKPAHDHSFQQCKGTDREDNTDPEIVAEEKDLKLFLAGEYMKNQSRAIQTFKEEGGIRSKEVMEHRPFILESFYYANEVTEKLIPYFGDFLLDSGAFTLRQNINGSIDWKDYIDKYADFIRRNKIQKYFELDIDNLIGYEETLKLRDYLENKVGWQSIPVWHPSRKWSEFIRSTKKYKYVALGGIVGAGKGTKEYKAYQSAFSQFIKEAHNNGAKIHGLGYTSLNGLTTNHFDSVDSTAWTTGNRFGYVYRFDGKTMQKHNVPKGKKLNSRACALNNYIEWIKFQKYAEGHL